MPINAADTLADVLDKYPSMMSTPSLAMSAAQSSNPDQTAAVAGYATQQAAAGQAAADQEILRAHDIFYFSSKVLGGDSGHYIGQVTLAVRRCKLQSGGGVAAV